MTPFLSVSLYSFFVEFCAKLLLFFLSAAFLSFFYLQISKKRRTFAIVIELERHIEILLLNNDCVIVPELGGFMTHHIEARYDEHDNMFLPPQRTLGFNPQLKLNDSLLAQSYIEAYDISYPEAIRRIEAEVTELKQRLESEGTYELNDLGVLSVNAEGKLEFEPCEAGILTPELYGLSSFEMHPLAVAKKPVAEPAAEAEHDIEADAQPDTAAAVLPLTPDTDEEQEDDAHGITIKMSWIRNAVAVAAAVLLFFIITTPVSNNDMSTVSKSQVTLPVIVRDTNFKLPDEPTHQMVEEALQQAADNTMAAAAKDTTALTADAEKDEGEVSGSDDAISGREVKGGEKAAERVAEAETSAESYYCIVLASQVSEPNANEFVGKLRQQGLSDARVYLNNNIRRVICGKYSSSDEAHLAVNKIHQMAGLADAWVYQVKESGAAQ